MKLKVAKTTEFEHELPTPKQQSEFSAGYDLQSVFNENIPPGERRVLDTGFCFEIPEGFAGFLWPRSGLAVKSGIHVMAGLIDSDYRGQVKVCLQNMSDEFFMVNAGDRIAQLVISPVLHLETELVKLLDNTIRADGGFGSTGK